MKRLYAGLIVLLAGAATTVFSNEVVTLPVEVMGPPPHDEAVVISITPDQAAETEYLWLQLHNVAYDGKALVQINDGSWFELWNETPEVEVAAKDKAYGGFGGGFQTIQCKISTNHFVLIAGLNTIRFRYGHKHPDFATAGFRVVRFNLLDQSGQEVLPPEMFEWDDPTTWQPPRNNPSDIAAGEAIWRYANLGMNARCTDCHTQDGFDLKYFNVSNKTIIEQCKKSGFTQVQGEQVASYIRSLDYPVVPEARPWNPPYQPGPDIETRADAAYKWAAGAGIDAVLESDQDMIVELFCSDAPTEAEVYAALNGYETEPNMRTQRISVQFPDWISWIPRTHPKDILSSDEVAALDLAYETLRETIINAGGAEGLNRANNQSVYNKNDIFKTLGEFAREAHKLIAPYDSQFPRSPTWANATALNQEERRSLAAWHSVKMFEVINEFGLHDVNYVNVDVQYPFQWPTRQWAVFQNAAHVIADKRGNSYFTTDIEERTQRKSIYLSSIWYQLQMVLTPGNRTCGIVVPNDYAYNLLHIQKISYRSKVFEPARFFQNYWQCAYQRNNGIAPADGGTVQGWNMRELSPWRLYGRATPDEDGQPVDLTFKELENYHPGLQSSLQSAFLRTTADILNGFSLAQVNGDFDRITLQESMDTGRTDFELEYRDVLPEYGVDNGAHKTVFMHRSSTKDGAGDAVEVDAFYTLVRLLDQERVVSQEAYYAIKDWTDAAWDTTTWTNWPTDPYSRPPFVAFLEPTSASINTYAGINFFIRADVSDDNGLTNVRLSRQYDANWEVVSDLADAPFIWGGDSSTNDAGRLMENLMPGEYLYRLVATDNDGQQTTATITVQVDLSLSDAYNNWVAQFSMPDQDALMNADPDSDQLNNVMEFALGGNPATTDDYALLPTLEINPTGDLTYQFLSLKNRDADGVIYTIEVTNDLTSDSWSTLSTNWTVSSLPESTDYELVEIPLDTQSDESKFLRLKITVKNRDDLP